tara:strand:+ start:544 stop:879 length:336 start_codon:yes stop_codon:yes gene_type:complete
MKTLTRKIKEALKNNENENKDYGYIYLDAEELTALVNMRRVQHFSISAPIDRYTEEQGSSYYEGFGSISISRAQAKEGIKSFVEHNEVKGSKTFAKVYISKWLNDRYYVSL